MVVSAPGGSSPRARATAVAVVDVAVFLAVWQAAVRWWHLANPIFLPAPSDIAAALIGMGADGSLVATCTASAIHWSLGFAVALILGLFVGLLMGVVRPVGRVLAGPAWAVYSMPFIVFEPMLVVWFGFGTAPIVALVALSAIFPIMLTLAAGVAHVDPSLMAAAKVYGASWYRLQWSVVLPHALPYLLAGIRLAIPPSLVGLLFGEILGSGTGLGRVLAVSSTTFRVDQTLATVVVIVCAAGLLLAIMSQLERHFAPWRD